MNFAHKPDQFAKADMAEDPRNRSRDPFVRPASPGAAGSASGADPLAELARLIGQNDPFADYSRERAATPRVEPRRDQKPADPSAGIDWRAVPMPASLRRPEQAAPQQQYAADPFAAHQHAASRHGAPVFPPIAGAQHALPQHAQQPAPAPQHYNGQAYPDLPGYQPAPGAETDPAYDPAAYDQAQGYDTDPYYREDQNLQPAAMYEEAGPARRRGGLLTVLAVLALAIVGTAGAFGYRAIFSKPGTLSAPPVIRADSAPTKVVPATQPSEPPSNKLIYDRVGDRNQGEKIVPREEQPVQIRDPNPARVVFPAPGQTSVGTTTATTSNGSAPAPVSSVPPGANEPKKIRTVTIRADQPGMPVAAPAPMAAPPATRAVPPPVAPVAAAPVQAAPEPAPRSVRTQPVPSGNAPLSLAPAAGPAPQAPAPRAAVAARAPAAADVGGYAVQVSSQRTEAEAQTSYRSLQAKYPSVLGDRQAIIRRADLGQKGVYYRAQVGPFATSEQANTFCNNLRTAGGQCIVQRN